MDQDDQSKSNQSSGYIKLAGVEDGEYDALADLFLGESELAPKPFKQDLDQELNEDLDKDTHDSPRASSQSMDSPIHQSASKNSAHAQQSQDLSDRSQENPINQSIDRSMDPMNLIGEVQARIDATMNQDGPAINLASAHTSIKSPNQSTAPIIETVLLGHLPVRASLWVRQYACSTARRCGQVIALIRAAAGSTSVDLISGTDGIQTNECSSLQEALALVSRTADRVILRVDETTEPDLLDRQEIDEITILTGADEAAVVSSYRLIKTLTTVWDSDETNGAPHIRLAVMGATTQQVSDASAKLNRAVDAFLDRPIEIIDAAGRIDATGTTNIFRDSVTHNATGILDQLAQINTPVQFDPSSILTESVQAIQSEIASAEQETVTVQSLIDHESKTAPKTAPKTASQTTPQTVSQNPPLSPSQPKLQIHTQHSTQQAAHPATQPVTQSAAHSATNSDTQAHSLRFHPEPKVKAERPSLDRIDLVKLIGGLEIIDLRCPFALDVQICVDTRGALHLVTGDAQEGPMARLETVRSWVRDHFPLILKAEPKVAMPDSNSRDTEIEMHLVTDKPQIVRGLIDSPVRLYALAQVQVRGESASALTPLN
ncbi:MAG: hypothetical protein AB8C13_03165 [Phycisphaerales bacterium]